MAEEEELDDQYPLRCLMQAELIGGDDPTCVVIPRQPHSVQDEVVNLSFPNIHSVLDPITITLAVDATPGCGGIAWPAGQVTLQQSDGVILRPSLTHPPLPP